MKTRSEMEHMAEVARGLAGWDPADMTLRPISAIEGDPVKARKDRAYAEGVEAGILWALGNAGEPFPR
jgi:hypothetical protein